MRLTWAGAVVKIVFARSAYLLRKDRGRVRYRSRYRFIIFFDPDTDTGPDSDEWQVATLLDTVAEEGFSPVQLSSP